MDLLEATETILLESVENCINNTKKFEILGVFTCSWAIAHLTIVRSMEDNSAVLDWTITIQPNYWMTLNCSDSSSDTMSFITWCTSIQSGSRSNRFITHCAMNLKLDRAWQTLICKVTKMLLWIEWNNSLLRKKDM